MSKQARLTMTPLQLEDSFLTTLSIQANPDYRPPGAGQPVPGLRVVPRVQLAAHESDAHRYQLTLTVQDDPDAEEEQPYALDLRMVGQFVVDEGLEHDRVEHLVAVNGASLLYSALREIVLMATGRSAWGSVQLPTMNFNRLTTEPAE